VERSGGGVVAFGERAIESARFGVKQRQKLRYVNAVSSSHARLQDVARTAGVSLMTVSRALRNAPRVAEGTRQRVLEAAKQLRYDVDPQLSRMMAMVRGRKRVRVRSVLGVIREFVPADGLLNRSYQYVPLEFIRQRARGFGYDADEFWLGRDGLSPERLQTVLRARGIEGVLVSPQSAQIPCSRIDYSEFASATFGYVMREPALHMCAGNMFLGVQLAAGELMRRGYKRIGLAINRWVDDRSQNGYSGGLFHFQQGLPVEQRVPLLMLPYNNLGRGFGAFSEWMRMHRPDALISFDTFVPKWLKRMSLDVPDDIGFVVHDWTPEMKGWAGIYQRRDHLAASAVDMVVAQLTQNERGVPAVPRQIMIPPEWVDGASVRFQ